MRSGTFDGGGTASSQALYGVHYRMERTWDRSAQTQSPGILTWRDGTVIHEWTCTSRIAHRPSPIARRPSPVANGAAPSLFPARSARGSHAMSSPADGAHLRHHLPYRQRAVRSLQFSLLLGITTQRNSTLALPLWPQSYWDDKKRHPLPSRPRDRGQVLLAGGPVLLRLLQQHQASVIVATAGILGRPPLTDVPRMASQVPNRVAKVLRRRYDTARPTDTCPGTGDPVPAAKNSNIEAWHGIDDMAWCDPGAVVSSEHNRHFNHLHDQVTRSTFILMRGKSRVGLERARKGKNPTTKDIHDGEQQRDSESAGHELKGAKYGYGALMPHDKQMIDACEDRDPTSIGDVLPLELPSVVWHIHEGVQRAACVWIHWQGHMACHVDVGAGTGMIATGLDKHPKYSLPPSPGNKKREQRPCVPKNPRAGFGCASTSSTMAPPGMVVAER
ncbi:hypothetical protein CSAL01_12097 [Colletotrichum salicis]|uniref:Uncharacterized protein n=1 Tax=Colletotrichum salicis TaxID=1209931 RepID=A0A135UI83_9PEZI|nr:hypothetical protein CSAL01_12097 [Colletotrichum salicis]